MEKDVHAGRLLLPSPEKTWGIWRKDFGWRREKAAKKAGRESKGQKRGVLIS